MRKKFLAMLLCLVTALGCAFGFTACGGGDNTGDGGNGGNKTEQSTPNEKPDEGNKKPDQTEKPGNDGDKTEDNKKPDGSDDDKKGDDEKDPDGSGDDNTVDQAEAFKAITDALQAKLDDEYGNGAEVLSIYTYVSARRDYLGLKVKYGNAIKDVGTSTVTKYFLDENGNITDLEHACERISKATLSEGKEFVGLYLSDSESATDKAFVKEMIESRVGTDCDIICGGVSAVTDVADDYMITNAAKFTVYALIADNDNKVYEYKETLIATKDNGNVYDTVIGGGSFRSDTKTETELGALADNYYAEQVRLAEIKNELKKDYQAVVTALQAKLDDEYGEGAEVLSICTYITQGISRLRCTIKYGNAIKTVNTTLVTTTWLDENGNITDVEKACERISKTTLTEKNEFVGLYLSDSENAVETALVQDMIENRVGKGYDIIYGAVSEATDVSNDSQISNAAKFTLYALIADKQTGAVSEYTETFIASKDSGSVYDAVLHDGSYRSDKKSQTELGALADKYYAVMR
ncbi:MAG: hypothetical protein K2O44_05875 [Clostridia bacterium]|nr:hypothetical protein [Clostridia bacterium]